MNSQRPIVPARPVTDSPVARRPIVPQQHASVASAPIVPRRTIVPASTPVVARAVIVHTRAPNNFVLDEEIDRSPPPAKVCLGDVAEQQFLYAANKMKDRAHRRRVLEDVVRADSCFVDGEYTHSRRHIRVEYNRNMRPEAVQAFSEAERCAPFPRMVYPKGDRFGKTFFLELTDDRCATEYLFHGIQVPLLAKGMYVKMFLERRTQSFDRWVYRPCTQDGYILQDFDLVGKFTGLLLEKQSADLPNQLRDVDWNAITLNDIKRFLCVIEFSRDDGTGIEIILVLDRERKVRCIVHEKQMLDDPDPELDRE